MTDTSNPGASGNGADARQFLLQQLFIKDLSFEAPNPPGSLQGATGEPDVKLNLRHSMQALPDDAYEVVLHVSVHAELKGKTVFLAELDQAGIFTVKGYKDEERKQLLVHRGPGGIPAADASAHQFRSAVRAGDGQTGSSGLMQQ